MPRKSKTPHNGLPPEDELVRRLTRGLPRTDRTLTGAGDDCAVLRAGGAGRVELFKIDAVVEHVHFTRDMPAEATGWKALCRAISDIAAMGGTPREALISLTAPPETPLAWVTDFYAGLKRAARRYGAGIAGGETTSAPPGSPLVISVALLGEAAENLVLSRGGARPGDVLAVTGRLGNSFASGWHLAFTPRVAEGQWLAAADGAVTAMMDVSDGIAKDLPRLARRSGCGWRLDLAALPLRAGADTAGALTDGEDHELLLTVRAERWDGLLAAWGKQFPRLPLTKIGLMAAPRVKAPALTGGWDHFSTP